MATTMLERIKLAVRISHSVLDEDIQSDIDACLADLEVHGVKRADKADPLIFNAVKLYCKAAYTDDPVKAEKFQQRYEKLRDSLKMAEGYGWGNDYE